MCLVGIKAESEQHGWEIFVTMNDRGVRLAPIDLLKGHLIEMARLDSTDLNAQWHWQPPRQPPPEGPRCG